MIFAQSQLAGVWVIDLERRADPRGHFARTFCADAFAAHDLPTTFPQCNLSFNGRKGTLRGMHWQDEPHAEGKLVRCTRGAVFDAVVDIRPHSATRHRWLGVELSAESGRSLYIPPGFAHGYQTLTDDAELFYQMTERYQPDLARGVRWDDPAFAIEWPEAERVMSDRDSRYKLISEW